MSNVVAPGPPPQCHIALGLDAATCAAVRHLDVPEPCGKALANRSGMSYPNLVWQEVTGPLGWNDTVVSLLPEKRARFLQGHSGNGDHKPVHAWDLDALAGAGALHSTAGEMLTYLEAQLHPDRFGSLSEALTESHRLRADVGTGERIARAWLYETDSGIYWHNGATAGYSSYAFFDPKHDYAAIVLLNIGPSLGPSAGQLGEHIHQRLAGLPSVSFARPGSFRNGRPIKHAAAIPGVLDHAVCGVYVRLWLRAERSRVGTIAAPAEVSAGFLVLAIGLFLRISSQKYLKFSD